MKPLRQWQAAKAWRHRLAEPIKRPVGEFRWGKSARLLLLVDIDNANALAETRAFAKTQRAQGASVRELGFTATKRPADQRSAELWDPSSLNFAGLPKKELEQAYLDKSYDLVVHCSLAPFEPFDYLVAGISAHRRVAAYDDVLEAYDLVVNAPKEKGLAAFLREIIRLSSVIHPQYANF